MKIQSIHLLELRNEEHCQFSGGMKELVTASGSEALVNSKQLSTFSTACDKEYECLDLVRKSLLTDELAGSDDKRDRTFGGMRDTINSATRHFNPEVSQAAERLKVVFDSYGNLAVKGYNQQTAGTNKLIGDLRGKFATEVSTVGVTDWLNELASDNNAVATLQKDRYTEKSLQVQYTMKDARTEVDAAYKKLVKLIEVLVDSDDGDAYGPLVNQMNGRIEKYNLILAQRKNRNAAVRNDETTGDSDN